MNDCRVYPLGTDFFARDAQLVACELVGKALFHWHGGIWRVALVVETEAYYLHERASHASLGWTPKRRALFMPAGTVYMYHARGGASCNMGCQGEGDAVLIKAGRVLPAPPAGVPLFVHQAHQQMLQAMQRSNSLPGGRMREAERLCAGQTLLCRSLGLTVAGWDAQPLQLPPPLSASELRVAPWRLPPPSNPQLELQWWHVGDAPPTLLRAARLGIAAHRHSRLPYRFLDPRYLSSSTQGRARAWEHTLECQSDNDSESAWQQSLRQHRWHWHNTAASQGK